MSALPPAHTSFLVDDLESSIAAYSATTGLAFDPIREMPIRMVGEGPDVRGQDVTEQMRVVYSTDGTVELVARCTAGMFAPGVPGGFHHMGQFADEEFELAVKRRVELGESVEWRVFLGDFPLAVYFAAHPTRPVRVEIVNPAVLSLPQ